MRKFLVKIALFFLLICLSARLMVMFDNVDVPADENVLRVKNCKYFSDLDYLFLGPSYTYCSFNPYIFDTHGYKTYNLGSYAAGPFTIEALIENYLSLNTPPKHIVICLSPFILSDRSDAWSAFPIHRYIDAPYSHEKLMLSTIGSFYYPALTLKQNITKKYNVLNNYLRLYHTSCKKAIRLLYFSSFGSAAYFAVSRKMLINKGYTFNKGDEENSVSELNETNVEDLRAKAASMKDYLYDTDKEARLLELINRYKGLNIQIIINEAPTLDIEKFYSEKFMNSYNKLRDKLALDNSLKLIKKDNFKAEISDFSDLEHLNPKGGKDYTIYFLNELKIADGK